MSRSVSSNPFPAPKTIPLGGNLLRFAEHRTPGGVSHQGGASAPGLPVQLLFWGAWWNGVGAAQRAEVEAKIKTLLVSQYTAALDQYGIAPPTWKGSIIVTNPGPPGTYNEDDIHKLVWQLIDDERFPEPDEAGGRNGYFVMMPQGTNPGDGNPGEHGADWEDDFPWLDVDWVWDAYVAYGDTDTMTAAFSHELVEMATDPESDAWYSQALGSSIGEIGDLCEPNDNWETAYVDGVKVMAYWSNRDGCCVIPASFFGVAIAGPIDVDAMSPDGEGDQLYPLGENNGLCSRYPDVCCLRGPYHWKRTRKKETATLSATAEGYHTPAFTWSIGGKGVSGSGKLISNRDVTRDTPTGLTTTNEPVSLEFKVDKGVLRVTNASVVGSFDVLVSVQASDEAAVSTSGERATGTRRSAAVSLPFIGEEFRWDDAYTGDLQKCTAQVISDYQKKHRKLLVPRRPDKDPGPRREADRLILTSLPAALPLGTRRSVRSVLVATERMAEKEPVEAAALRSMLLRSLGVRVP